MDPCQHREHLMTRRNIARRFFLTIPLLFVAFGFISQAVSQVVGVGATLVAGTTVSLRSAPPSQSALGLVSDAGQQTGVLQRGDLVHVVDSRTIKVLLATHTWIEVDANGKRGWVFYGDDGKSSSFSQAR